MVQYAQPERGVKPAVAAMQTAVSGHDDGVDVLYHGRRFFVSDESVAEQPPIPNEESNWFDRLPLPWYAERMDADVASTESVEGLESQLQSRPPVVVAATGRADEVRTRVSDYRTFSFDMRAHVGGPSRGTSVVVFVDERRLE
jgi:predicted membrane-bound mannosyltransferase